MNIDRRLLNYVIIILLSFATFSWTFLIFHKPFSIKLVLTVILFRLIASTLIYKDYSLSWSKVSPKTFLLKSVVYLIAFIGYAPIFYGKIFLYFLISELFTYLFGINFLMYAYNYFINKSRIEKTKNVAIYGAGKAGLKLKEEFADSPYKLRYFIDDDQSLHNRSIDGIPIVSKEELKRSLKSQHYDLLVIAMPSASPQRIKEIYEELNDYFEKIKILPSFDTMLKDEPYSDQLKDLSLADLLARNPQDLDKDAIASFIRNKTILITGAGGSIGSEIARQCVTFGAKKLILLDHSEYNLYRIEQELNEKANITCIMQSVTQKTLLENTFKQYMPQIVIHAAAYKHVPLVEENIDEAILNNVIGTKNCIDLSIAYGVEKFILISSDKAVRPTNVMGATKRICELYAQNAPSQKTEIVAVRFGNVLGSSGSVIPKFRQQIENGGPVTVTHPEITRYFMLIPEACELVLQAGAIGKGGEIFILDMGKPVKIVDLAKKMIKLSGKKDIKIIFTGLRPGEKLYEELLIEDVEAKTRYESIFIAGKTDYDFEKLNRDIDDLLKSNKKIAILRRIVPEYRPSKN